MTKSNFIKKLSEKLRILEESEVEGIINEYSYHIDQKIREGKSEEEAIADFGDFDELVKSILAAYHIDKKPPTMEDYFQSFLRFINKVTEKIMAMESGQMVSFVVELVVLIILLRIINLPFHLLLRLTGGLFTAVTWGLFAPLKGVFNYIFEVIYVVISVYVIYLFVNKRLFSKD